MERKLTNKDINIILELLLKEQNCIHKMTYSAQILLESYRLDLANIYQKMCDLLEEETEI